MHRNRKTVITWANFESYLYSHNNVNAESITKSDEIIALKDGKGQSAEGLVRIQL